MEFLQQCLHYMLTLSVTTPYAFSSSISFYVCLAIVLVENPVPYFCHQMRYVNIAKYIFSLFVLAHARVHIYVLGIIRLRLI